MAAALPGGDPLAAALAAGETPSPELVAAVGEVGVLAPATAWALMALVLASGWSATAWFAPKVRFYRLAPGMRSPEVLAARAGDFVDAIGYGVTAAGFVLRLAAEPRDRLYVRDRETAVDRWETLARADAPAVSFVYRQSPRPLVPLDATGDVHASRSAAGRPRHDPLELTRAAGWSRFTACRRRIAPPGAPGLGAVLPRPRESSAAR